MLLGNDNECYMPQFRGKIGTKEKKKMKKASFVTYFFFIVKFGLYFVLYDRTSLTQT